MRTARRVLWLTVCLACLPPGGARDGSASAGQKRVQQIRVWDVATGKRTATWRGPAKAEQLALAPDGKTLATGEEDGTVRLWDARRGVELARFRGAHRARVSALAFAPDGRALASGDMDCRIVLWDVAGKARPRSWRMEPPEELGSRYGVQLLLFAPNGKTLGSAGARRSGVLDLWEVASGKLRQRIRDHSNPLRSAAADQSDPCGSGQGKAPLAPDRRGPGISGHRGGPQPPGEAQPWAGRSRGPGQGCSRPAHPAVRLAMRAQGGVRRSPAFLAEPVAVLGVVEPAVAGAVGLQHGAHQDQRGQPDLDCGHRLGQGAERAAEQEPFRPGNPRGHDDGGVRAGGGLLGGKDPAGRFPLIPQDGSCKPSDTDGLILLLLDA
jgi:hypothetical protein